MDRPGHKSKKFFVGHEVEHTPTHGQKTLFVIGYQPAQDIQAMLADPFLGIGGKVTHIYFGADHSFVAVNKTDWQSWSNLIETFLDQGYWCTLDFEAKYSDDLLNTRLIGYNTFVPMISVRLPYIRQFNYNTVVKIDDHDFAATNPGVWCHRLHDLQRTDCFTDWSEYSKDETLK